MHQPTLRIIATACILAAAGAQASLQQPAQQQQVPGAIRTRVTLVPLDVRVIDRNGVPVTDLTEKDFVVLEDGVPQKIGHFSLHTLTPQAPGPARPQFRKALDATVEEQGHRTFLIVLGRGRLHGWAGAYTGAIRFVRDQLLPQDKVAIAAWNHATDFTTDHARLVLLLERLRDKHNGLELKLQLRHSGLEAIYGSKTLPPDLQAQVDAIFDDEELRPRQLAAVRIRDQEGYDNAMRRQFEATMDLMVGGSRNMVDPRFDEFFRASALSQSTLSMLYSSIEYLKYFDGEKHLVLLNEGGIYLPRAEDDEGLAATASDARVAVHTILTTGTPAFGASADREGLPGLGGPVGGATASPFSQVMVQSGPLGPHAGMFAISTMRTFATRSGGFFSTTERVPKILDRIDAATRTRYVLGYYPANSVWDGDYRKIEVKVNKPGLTVMSRRGYFATDQLVPFDRQQFLTYSRIASAGESQHQLDDIRMSITARVEKADVIVEGTIDPSRLPMAPVDGVRSGELDLAIFIGDRSEDIVGEKWQKIAITLRDPSQPAPSGRIPFTVRVPVKGAPRFVKAVVYDYAADLVGTATARVR